MKFIKPPTTHEADTKVLKSLCKNIDWRDHETNWIACYDKYYSQSGDPWEIQPFMFGKGIDIQQNKLYTDRRNSGPLKKIRQMTGLLCCPVCGSGSTGNLDHYLPRDSYPEFSIMRSNLVPACSHCNSGVKGSTIKGDVPPARFIHPYFDKWADSAIWFVVFEKPFEAVSFIAQADKSLPKKIGDIVAFHLSNVLGDQFHRSLENLWSTFPQRMMIELVKYTREEFQCLIDSKLKIANLTTGLNSWESAFFRGLTQDDDAVEHLRQVVLAEAGKK